MPINKELKEERRAQGMCVYCGRPAVIKRDGKPKILRKAWYREAQQSYRQTTRRDRFRAS